MTCTVYDKLYLDWMAQPICGTFTLKLGAILCLTRRRDNEVIELFGDLLKCLNYVAQMKQKKNELTVTDILNTI